jgi:hypothetical protein
LDANIDPKSTVVPQPLGFMLLSAVAVFREDSTIDITSVRLLIGSFDTKTVTGKDILLTVKYFSKLNYNTSYLIFLVDVLV